VFCRLVFVLLSIFFWPLHYLSFDLRLFVILLYLRTLFKELDLQQFQCLLNWRDISWWYVASLYYKVCTEHTVNLARLNFKLFWTSTYEVHEHTYWHSVRSFAQVHTLDSPPITSHGHIGGALKGVKQTFNQLLVSRCFNNQTRSVRPLLIGVLLNLVHVYILGFFVKFFIQLINFDYESEAIFW